LALIIVGGNELDQKSCASCPAPSGQGDGTVANRGFPFMELLGVLARSSGVAAQKRILPF
jgi:hypothetical protein